MRRLRFAILVAVLGAAPNTTVAQPVGAAGDALVDVLVWGLAPGVDLNEYPPAVRQPLERLLARAQAYRSSRPEPKGAREEPMVYAAQVRYERLLAVFADDPKARPLAVTYIERLRPCYEWEGYHECPEREASFASEYWQANPTAPFSAMLPLLAAHRWLCAADAYDYEKRPADAARSRRAYDDAIAIARQTSDTLIRAGAEALSARPRCFPR